MVLFQNRLKLTDLEKVSVPSSPPSWYRHIESVVRRSGHSRPVDTEEQGKPAVASPVEQCGRDSAATVASNQEPVAAGPIQ